MSFSFLATIAFTVCLCRCPTKKPVAVPDVKCEEVSDVELWPASQQPKGKAPAHLESPIVISDDESAFDRFPVPPKMKGHPSGTVPNALEDQQYLLRVRLCICYG